MGTEAFIEKNFRRDSLAIIAAANDIIEEYRKDGFTLTLRQLYYQFVARDLIKNQMSEYKRLGAIINDARLAGFIDWEAIEDRTRNVKKPNTWESPQEIVTAVAAQYQEDLWAGQDYRVEVWIEKDALIGVIEPVCERYRVPYFACRGNVSQSEQWRAGKRFENIIADGVRPVVLHLGDHDPSGIDMTRDNQSRLSMFAYDRIEVRRLALNMDQVRAYRPPPNPAKESDSRFAAYAAKFGDKSWELDALDPKVIDRLIARELDDIIDPILWKDAEQRETERKATLGQVAEQWDRVVRTLTPRAKK